MQNQEPSATEDTAETHSPHATPKRVRPRDRGLALGVAAVLLVNTVVLIFLAPVAYWLVAMACTAVPLAYALVPAFGRLASARLAAVAGNRWLPPAVMALVGAGLLVETAVVADRVNPVGIAALVVAGLVALLRRSRR